MDFNFNEDQRQFADLARQFAAEELAPFAAKWDEEHHFPKDVIQKAGELGFCSLYSPESEGGMGFVSLRFIDYFRRASHGLHRDHRNANHSQYGHLDDHHLGHPSPAQHLV
jgi:alkylation response protein AidB-like acyl-CoA dehydrogenase